ncbi:MAG: hypothetical protein IPH16_14365 [Haliscomenobacter sp.]|nr:hypothetical protein [Haliscomenobacter sp.]
MEKSAVEEIKRLISYGKTEEAIQTVIAFAENTTLINEALQLSSRYKKEKFNIINGLTSQKDNTEINSISFSVLNLVDELFLSIKTDQSKFNHTPEYQIIDTNRDRDDAFETVIGLKIDKYQITEYIHSGGFGSVYKA